MIPLALSVGHMMKAYKASRKCLKLCMTSSCSMFVSRSSDDTSIDTDIGS